MAALSSLDWLVVLIFAGVVLALGLSAKLKEASALQFLTAGRTLTLPMFVATLVCTWYGGILGIGESVSYYGLGTLALMGVPYYVFALIYALFYAGRIREADQISIPERLTKSFGEGPGRISAGLIFLLGVPAAHVLMLGVLAQSISGLPLGPCILIGVVFGSLFLIKGGLLADVKVSILSFLMMYVGFALLVGWCLVTMPPATTWASIENKQLFKWDGGVGPLAVISFFLLGAWTLIDPGFHQRAASAADPKTAKRGILVSILCWMVFDLMTITAGMYALAVGPKDLSSPLLLFPALGGQVLPDGVRGIFFCGLLGTIITAMVGYALVSGAALGRDLFSTWNSRWSEVTVTRLGIGVSLAVAVFLAWNIQSVVALWYSWGGCIIGALLIPVSSSYGVLGKSKAKPVWHGAAMVIAFACSLGLFIWGLSTGNQYLTVTLPTGYNLPEGLAGAQFGLGTLVPSLVVSFSVTMLGSWVSRNESRT